MTYRPEQFGLTQPRQRIISKIIIRNQFGLLETTPKLGVRKHFYATRKQAAKSLRRLHSMRLARSGQ